MVDQTIILTSMYLSTTKPEQKQELLPKCKIEKEKEKENKTNNQ